MSSLKLLHSGGNGVIIAAPSSNPAANRTITLNDNYAGDGSFVTANSSGNVGIGTSSPAAKLQVHGNMLFSATTPQIQFNSGGPIIKLPSANTLAFLTDSTNERMRIRSTGGLMIGDDGSTRIGEPKLHVLSGGSGNNIASFFFNTTDDRDAVLIRHNGADGGNTRKMIALLNADGNAVGNIISTGSSTSYNTSSDYRLKENAVAISDGITRLKTLKPYRFNFKANPTQTVDGFFAHEVTAVPEAIYGEKDGSNMQQIDQSKLVPLLTAALQEEVAKREALEARVAALEGA